MSKPTIEEILLNEVRTNRKSIDKLTNEISNLKLSVFSNKVKLSLIIASVSICTSIIVALVIKKIEAYIV
jgi:hypothetical protein